MSENVIDFDAVLTRRDVDNRPPIKRKNIMHKSGCKHDHMVLDFNGRIVECEDCGRELDPYQALEIISRSVAYRTYKVKRLEELEQRRNDRNNKARERRQRTRL